MHQLLYVDILLFFCTEKCMLQEEVCRNIVLICFVVDFAICYAMLSVLGRDIYSCYSWCPIIWLILEYYEKIIQCFISFMY
jgi:hypothetical protein